MSDVNNVDYAEGNVYFRFPSASSSFVLDAFSGFPWINLGKVSDLRSTFREIHASVFLAVLDSGIFCMCTVS